ncbi:hypothetical protein NPIL_568221 [Nephila pilipes]|uniref:Uncharacterized protein n=1 Tax=Nephila pilipes TaxID=299642 RepID=A0A8X6MH33_NEPPI|nr:hypothetical protein NPIL_568221 [Nephila pilipes]
MKLARTFRNQQGRALTFRYGRGVAGDHCSSFEPTSSSFSSPPFVVGVLKRFSCIECTMEFRPPTPHTPWRLAATGRSGKRDEGCLWVLRNATE